MDGLKMDLEGNKVWSPWDLDTTYADYAGGSKDNRLTVQKILLEKGITKLGLYQMDTIHQNTNNPLCLQISRNFGVLVFMKIN